MKTAQCGLVLELAINSDDWLSLPPVIKRWVQSDALEKDCRQSHVIVFTYDFESWDWVQGVLEVLGRWETRVAYSVFRKGGAA